MKASFHRSINTHAVPLSGAVLLAITAVIISSTVSATAPASETLQILSAAGWIVASAIAVQVLYRTRQDAQKRNDMLEGTETLSRTAGWELVVTSGQVLWTGNMYSLHGLDHRFFPSLELACYTERSRHELRDLIRRVVQDAKQGEAELEMHPVDGKSAWTRWIIAPIVEHNTVIRLRGAVINVTGEKELEGAFHSMRNMLEKSNTDMSRILKVAAHDLRSPVNSIIGLTSLITPDEALTSDSRQIFHLITESSERAKRLINEIMTMTSLEDEMKVNATLTDVRTLLINLTRELQFSAAEKNLLIQVDCSKTIIANIDSDKIIRAITNIIGNAIKFSIPGKSIRISLRALVNTFVISITDDGIGIPVELKEHVFEMFTPAKRPGTAGEKAFGLGLHISKKMVECHDGRIWVESENGKGTSFHLELPIARSKSNGNKVYQVA